MPTNTSTIQLIDPMAHSADGDSFQPESDQWVALRNAPSDYSHNEALLLCETSLGEWIAWIPGFGEITLNRSQFHQSSCES